MLHELTLSDGRKLTIQETPAESGSLDWIVFLPGSGAELWELGWPERRALFGSSGQGDAGILVINKPGIAPDGRISRLAFEKSFRRWQRLEDYLEVLETRIPEHASILLVGFSEGAYLAPDIALRDPRVKSMALISGGTRSWIDEEIFKASPQTMKRVMKRVAQIYARPESVKGSWFGYSYATWTSYDTDDTLRALEQLDIPILTLHGSEDRMIDLDSALSDLERLQGEKKPIMSRIFLGVDHTLEDKWLHAWRAVGRFRAQLNSDTMASATRMPSQAALVIPPA